MKINSVLIAFTVLFLTLFGLYLIVGFTIQSGIGTFNLSIYDLDNISHAISDVLVLSSFIGLCISLLKIIKEPEQKMRVMCAFMAVGYFTYNYSQTFLINSFFSYMAVAIIVITTLFVITHSKN